jgi:transposase
MIMTRKSSAEKTVRVARRAARKHYSSEETISIVLERLRGKESVAELCCREGIKANLYYRWSKDSLEAGKKRLSGDIVLEAASGEVKDLRAEKSVLKETVAELFMESCVLNRSVLGDGERGI